MIVMLRLCFCGVVVVILLCCNYGFFNIATDLLFLSNVSCNMRHVLEWGFFLASDRPMLAHGSDVRALVVSYL